MRGDGHIDDRSVSECSMEEEQMITAEHTYLEACALDKSVLETSTPSGPPVCHHKPRDLGTFRPLLRGFFLSRRNSLYKDKGRRVNVTLGVIQSS